jgi:hypothetical protein
VAILKGRLAKVHISIPDRTQENVKVKNHRFTKMKNRIKEAFSIRKSIMKVIFKKQTLGCIHLFWFRQEEKQRTMVKID